MTSEAKLLSNKTTHSNISVSNQRPKVAPKRKKKGTEHGTNFLGKKIELPGRKRHR